MSTTVRSFPAPGIRPQTSRSVQFGLAVLALIVLAASLQGTGVIPDIFPASWDLHLREPVDQFKSWVIANRNTHPMFIFFFDPLSDLIEASLRGLEQLLLALPWPALFIFLYALGYKAGGHRIAVLAVA